MTTVFCIVVADEGLLCGDIVAAQAYPVAVLHGSGIAGTLLLFLHLHIKLLLVDGKAILTTDQFCEVERESVGVEQTESLYTI